MADQVHFELVSPERLELATDVEMVVVPGSEGDFGVLPGHMPLISTVRPGVIYVFRDGKVSERIFVEGGFAEVTPESCTILAEHARVVSEIELSKASQEAEDAKEDLEDAKDEHAREHAAKLLSIAEARLAAATEASAY
ncbi:MAG TPA: F0F1 ATP synthase subunit epsilon [Dongiaceae bacterium]|nr:F0F1 ATP synthase subunit epsilon [Dongiaceae bacterium]